MKYLDELERRQVAGEYFAPTGLYEYTKNLPFLGSVNSNIQTLEAGEWTEIVIVYEVGASGLADGAWIKGTFKFYSVRMLVPFDSFRPLLILDSTGLGPVSNVRPLCR